MKAYGTKPAERACFYGDLVVKIDGGERFATLVEPLGFHSASAWRTRDDGVEVAAFRLDPGFRFDFESIPALFIPLTGHRERTAAAGAIHDGFYRTKLLERGDADAVFYEALRAKGVGRAQATVRWAAVRAFGRSSYGAPIGLRARSRGERVARKILAIARGE
jgi:hypothetical protein